jgi:hypothetical protein
MPEPGSLKPMCSVLDRRLVGLAHGRHPVAGDAPVGDVDQGGIDVHVLKEVLLHKAVIGVEVLPRHRVVLVQVEGGHAPEGEPFLAVHPDQLAIDADRGGSGGQAEHRAPAFPLPLPDHLGYPDRHRPGQGFVAVEHGGAEAFGAVHVRNLRRPLTHQPNLIHYSS